MHILIAHNEHGAPSGEERALDWIGKTLVANHHQVEWFLRSSAEIQTSAGKVGALFSGIYSFKSKKAMEAVLSARRPDIVHVQNLYPFLSPSILAACRERGVPTVMRCPNYRLFCPSGLHLSHGEICERCLGGKEYWCVLRNCERDFFKSLGYALRNYTARVSGNIVDNVSVFIVLSEFQRQRFIQGGIKPDRIEVLPLITAPPANAASSENLGDLITYVGRASPEKGIEDFVAAAGTLPDLSFAVAGALERMPQLVHTSPKNIKWLGFLNEKDLTDVYRRSRIIVMPSRCYESFSNAVADAMIMGIPVIASRRGGLPEVVDDGSTGLLFEGGNVEELVSKIKSLYSNANLCSEMGRAGKIKAQIQYSPEAVYARLMEIYQKALRNAF